MTTQNTTPNAPTVGAQHAVPAQMLDIEELEAIHARCAKLAEEDGEAGAYGFAIAFIGAVPQMLTEMRQNRAELAAATARAEKAEAVAVFQGLHKDAEHAYATHLEFGILNVTLLCEMGKCNLEKKWYDDLRERVGRGASHFLNKEEIAALAAKEGK